jgi:Holliday junction resolvase RusA-like endonuclease
MLAPSKQLREFKVNALAELAAFPRPQIVPDAAYVLVLEWHMQYLETQKWVKTRKGGRWVRKDVSNLVKSIEDVVCTYLGTDDSANMVVIATKVATNDNPCIRAFVYLLEM